jgi:hypothetical protein
LLSADILIHLIHKSKVPPMAGIGGGGGGGGGAGMMGSCDQCAGRFAQCALSLRQVRIGMFGRISMGKVIEQEVGDAPS